MNLLPSPESELSPGTTDFSSLPVPKKFEHYLPKGIPDNFLSIREYGWQKCIPRHGVNEAKLFFVIHIIISGKGTFTFDGVTHHLSTGDGFVIVPGEPISYEADPDDPWHYTWISFNGINAARLLNMAGLLKCTCFRPKRFERLATHFYNLCTGSESASDPEFARIGFTYLIFSELIEHNTIITGSKNKHFFERVEEYIEENFDKGLTIENVARRFAVSRSQLYRVFMEKVEMSPKEYLLQLKFNKACLLLEQSDYLVSEVGSAAGFPDASHFSKMFKKRFGVSPVQYANVERAQHANGEREQYASK